MGNVQFFTDGPGIMAGADPSWQLKQRQVDAIDTFKSGLPTDANGNVDYNAAAKMLFQKGDFANAGNLMQVGLQQRAIQAGLSAADDISNGGIGTGAPTATPATSTGGASNVFGRMIGTESGGKQFAPDGTPLISPKGAVGVAQIMPGTGPEAAQLAGLPWDETRYRTDPVYNLRLGKAYFDAQVKAFGSPDKAAAAYNAGPAAVTQAIQKAATSGGSYLSYLPAETQAYVQRVIGGGASSNSGAGQPAPASDNSAPIQVAQNGTSDAPSSTNPYAAAKPAGNTPQALSAPAVGGGPAASAPSVGDSNSSNIIDPTMGGLLKGQWIGNPGGYVSALRGQAVRLATFGNTAAAQAYDKQADAVERGIERNNVVTNTMKDYQIARQQGYSGSMMQYAADLEAQKEVARLKAQGDPSVIRAVGQKAQAEAEGSEQGKIPYELVPTQPTPGGPTVLVPKLQILAGNTPAVSQQPAAFAKRQDELAKQDADALQAYQRRQIAKERIDAMTNLLSTFQTGAGADQKAAAVAAIRALGINIPDSATANPSAVEQFSKNTTANIFDQAKSLGSKVLVSELAGLQKSNANPNMQPASNAAILAQQRGLLDWQDAHDKAYFDWRQANPYAYDPSQFEEQWAAKNPPSAYVAAARKNIAALGAPLPPKSQLVDGQAYMVRGQKVRWNASAGGFVPDQPGQ